MATLADFRKSPGEIITGSYFRSDDPDELARAWEERRISEQFGGRGVDLVGCYEDTRFSLDNLRACFASLSSS